MEGGVLVYCVHMVNQLGMFLVGVIPSTPLVYEVENLLVLQSIT